MKDKPQLEEVFHVSWIESERGWGFRPDGCSLHLTKDDYQKFLKKYWDKMPNSVPDEYSKPSGEPEIVYVSPELYKRIQRSYLGIQLGECEEKKLIDKRDLIFKKQENDEV